MKDWKDILYDQVINDELKKRQMNLYKRLKPQYKQKLDSANIDYPNTIEYIMNELENTYFVSDMKYGVVGDLQCMLKITLSPYEFFEDVETPVGK